jgi:hypothetical protein
MINTVSDLLEEIKEKGLELIKKYEIVNHPVLIGDMYEGLTQKLLTKGIFQGLNLKIVGGKIVNSKGKLSSEIDCMLVEGEGDPIPFTEKYIYHFNQVIAVIQVKKSLKSQSLDDAYWNLKSVMEVSNEPDNEAEPYILSAAKDAYRGILMTKMPNNSTLRDYTDIEQYMYHTLLMEAYFPIRIVFAFFGYKTEYGLREGFSNMIEKKVEEGNTRGFGANSLPNLIISGQNSIIKNNGMPFGQPLMKDEFYWPIYMTAPHKPMYFLLELIWTRLSYKYKISSEIFGEDDFNFETVHKYINCKLSKQGDKYGWEYKYYPFSAKVLNSTIYKERPWEPSFLESKQFAIIMQLCKFGKIDIGSNDFINSISRDKQEFESFIDKLIETGVVYKRGNNLFLLTDECATAVLPDGRFVVGENRNGEMDYWLKNYMNTVPKSDKI